MGRFETTVTGKVMTAGEVADYLLKTCKTLQKYESYMFGSSLYRTGSDFDILIVGPCGETLSLLKLELAVAGKELPLDILYMLPAEAQGTNFITKQGCIKLSELASYAN